MYITVYINEDILLKILEIIGVIITFSDLQIDRAEECLYIQLVKLLHTEKLVIKKKIRY